MSASLAQLVDMGIPPPRARAALKRTKDDVMSAAERVFAGDFDDIASDDEDAGGEDLEMLTPRVTSPVDADPKILDGEDDGDESESMNGSIGDDCYEMDEEDGNADHVDGNATSDPYANVFFSKDRVEEVIESIEEDQEEKAGESSTKPEVVSRQEWMRGCPEGNEQSFLFQHYTYLESGQVSCPGGCNQTFERSPSDFFAVLPDFTAFQEHVREKVRRSCGNCRQVVCMACGEKATADGRNTGKARSKHAFSSTEDRAELLHCPNLQGVMIGMGLYMIDQTFHTAPTTSNPAITDAPPAKRSRRLDKLVGTNYPPKQSQKMWHVKKPKKEEAAQDAGSDAATPIVMADNDGDVSDAQYDSDEGPYPKGGKKSARGTGYAGNQSEDHSGQLAAAKAEKERDEATTTLLAQVQYYLPSLAREGAPCVSDHMVHPTALAHLRRRSTFVNDLLKNESLLDMSTRGDLYRALLDWLKVISNHESLASMLAMPQMRSTSIKPSPNDPYSRIVTYEGSASPRELLENCVIQAGAALIGLNAVEKVSQQEAKTWKQKTKEEKARMTLSEAAKHEAEVQAEKDKDEDVQLRVFCQRIVDAAEGIDRSLSEVKGEPFVMRMRASLPKIPEIGDHIIETKSTTSSGEAVIKIYEEWATRARFQYCDMTRIDGPSSDSDGTTPEEKTSNGAKPVYRHHFDRQLKATGNNAFRGRMRAIAQEMGILSTSLPVAWHSTIFVRVDSTRPDCLKAMIIGPQGTPYENGCFLFDIYLPDSYNTNSPKVQSMTTNGGLYRYNPNLYADGKVCLSLLGTWQGPGWISGKSTLLQVLISIQSLILCEEPYLNEPGWASEGGSASSKAYSANVRRMVLKDAMANNLKSPPFPFENEIKTHFRLKKESIKAQIAEWKKLDDGKGVEHDSYSGIYHAQPGGTKAVIPSPKGETPFDKAATELVKLLDGMDIV